MKHGDQLNFSVLGEAHIVECSTVMSSGFGYKPPPSNISVNQSLIACFDDFYVIIEKIAHDKTCVLFPNIQSPRILGLDIEDKTFNKPLNENSANICRLALTAITQEPYTGFCYRGKGQHRQLCSFQVTPRKIALHQLQAAIIQVVEFGLMQFEASNDKSAGSHSATSGLALAVEMHKY